MVTAAPAPPGSLPAAAHALGEILMGRGQSSLVAAGADRTQIEIVDAAELRPRPLTRRAAPPEVWGVDGGQGLVRDARCFSLWITRAARTLFRDARTVSEHEGPLRYHLLGVPYARDAAVSAFERLGLAAPADLGLEGAVHLLRDAGEWEMIAATVEEAAPGAFVLVDGDLQPDWRIPSTFTAGLLARAAERAVTLVGVTKHSSLVRDGAPLVGQLELEAGRELGGRGLWWTPVGVIRHDLGPSGGEGTRAAAGHQVCVARLDSSAPFAFRVDLPAGRDPEAVLGALSAVCDDAAFPGYPYPLAVADRLAACPRWLCDEARSDLDGLLDRQQVPLEVRERAFADRHSLMERA